MLSKLLYFLPILAQVSTVNAWATVSPVQALFPTTVLDTVIAFIPEKSAPSVLSASQANTIAKSIFSPTGYDLANRYNEYSSGAIKMTGLTGTSDPYVTVKYIDKGIDSCDRGAITDAVYKAIAPANPARLIIVSNTRTPVCPGYSDNSGTVTMVWTVDALNPHVLFHELGHSLTFPHPATASCYSNGAKVMMSNNCTSLDSDDFQNMGTIRHDSSWYKADGITNIDPKLSGSLEYSSYYRLSAKWPMLKESNIKEVSGNGTFTLYSSETASIGTKTTALRIPLSRPIKISNDMVSTGVTYHTHYYVEFVQRRPNTVAGGVYNYVVIRTAPDHRSKRSVVTRFMSALSKDDSAFTSSFYDGERKIRLTLTSISSSGATIDVSFHSGYTPSADVNSCYYSSVIEPARAITVNNSNVCRALSRDNLPSVGTFNGTHCLIPYSNVGHVLPMPNIEFLHCLNTPKWITAAQSTMQDGFEIFDESDMYVCQTTIDGKLYQGRGHLNECCVYYNDRENCQWYNAATKYLAWLNL
ncbi:hypothetical protein H4R99_005456 [Coemansia sp. RSA 1722]|nr:hypothetical protein LPJ57_003064 [Coemansia sp. RSA 486]KAJ2233107.1 hypothetical protein IWW45_004451 [Coemansia sp. RSA 485]KAJ2595187.1 hypothetical protein H4R99_005456 [Coemansia sp. RSA 1722]KAJ2596773.1 hypothetical protein GGF39_003306 [Coemansia sp. RSA 1721]